MKATDEIRQAYRVHLAQHGGAAGDWMAIATLAERTDLTLDQIHAAIRELHRTDHRFGLVPESNQKAITDEQHAAAILFGGRRKHLICWS